MLTIVDSIPIPPSLQIVAAAAWRHPSALSETGQRVHIFEKHGHHKSGVFRERVDLPSSRSYEINDRRIWTGLNKRSTVHAIQLGCYDQGKGGVSYRFWV